jgi:hypothetical protein
MADLFSVTAPLLIKLPSGSEHVMAEKYPHPEGLVFFDLYWLENDTPAVHVIKGDIKGEGPWKVGDAIVRVLSCGDTALSMHWNNWQQEVLAVPGKYHDDAAKIQLARQHGASV